MTQKINDKLKKCCELCQSNLDKPCAWLSLGNEYCDTIMEVQADIEIKDKVIEQKNRLIKSQKQYIKDLVEKVGGEDEYNRNYK